MTTLLIMFAGALVGRFLPTRVRAKNGFAQFFFTLLLIFSMGLGLGLQEDFFAQLASLGLHSFLFCLLPTAGSALVVYAGTLSLTQHVDPALKGHAGASGTRKRKTTLDPMMFYAIGVLVLGVGCGVTPGLSTVLHPLTLHSDCILHLLMFSVGISVGGNRGILAKLRNYGGHVVFVPFGILAGSLLGGALCGLILRYPLHQALSIGGGLGWYSLAGVSISSLADVSTGGVAFLSNLMREIASFILIPWVAHHANAYTCIAIAGATSEDTTLPMILRYSDEQTAVFSVLNGIICSAFVPVLLSLCY